MKKAILGSIAASVAVFSGAVGALQDHSETVVLPDNVSITDKGEVRSLQEAKAMLSRNLNKAEKQYEEEMNYISDQYSLPVGATFQSSSPFAAITEQIDRVSTLQKMRVPDAVDSESKEVWYEPGYFKSDALVQWQCAWLKEAVIGAESGDQTRTERAVSQLKSFTSRKEASMFPDYEDFLSYAVDPLSVNNTDPAKEFINSGFNCVEQNQLD